MSELSPETRALLARANEGAGLSSSDRARIKQGVLALAAAGAVAGSASAGVAAAKQGATWALSTKLLATVVAIGVAIGGGIAWHRSRGAQAPPPTASLATPRVHTGEAAPPETPPRAQSPLPERHTEPTTHAPAPPASALAVTDTRELRAEPRARARSAARDRVEASETAAVQAPEPERAASATTASAASLLEEARLVREAKSATKEGDTTSALRLLDEHATRFPLGVLEPEREAERIFALCKAGRLDVARREAARFVATARPTLLVARVRASCAGAELAPPH